MGADPILGLVVQVELFAFLYLIPSTHKDQFRILKLGILPVAMAGEVIMHNTFQIGIKLPSHGIM